MVVQDRAYMSPIRYTTYKMVTCSEQRAAEYESKKSDSNRLFDDRRSVARDAGIRAGTLRRTN